jgi:uncharacterized protein
VRVVLDTNVLLAAIATHGLCAMVVTIVNRDHVVVLSEHILTEVSKHYQEKFKATKSQARGAVAVLRSSSTIVVPAAVAGGVLKDKDDLPVLGTAVAGAADCIITGDQELLSLKCFDGIDIVSPRQWYEALRRL